MRERPCSRGACAVWTVATKTLVQHQVATLALHPNENEGEGLKISYILDYGPHSPIERQRHTVVVTPESFVSELAPCRTFVLEEEALDLRRNGIGINTTAKDLLVFGKKGPIDNKLRFANEPARHKVLDLVGDLSLFGFDLCGHVVAYRSGHPLNVRMVHELTSRLPQTKVARLAA